MDPGTGVVSRESIRESDLLILMIVIIVALWTFGDMIPYFIKVAITTGVMFLFMSLALVVGPREEEEENGS